MGRAPMALEIGRGGDEVSGSRRAAASPARRNRAAPQCARRHRTRRRSDRPRSSLKCRSTETSGYSARNSGRSGATSLRPKDIGTARRTSPRGLADWAWASLSAASPSARMRAARSSRSCPASVSASRREVRLNSRAPSLFSSLAMALDTVALESSRSLAAARKRAEFGHLGEDREPFEIGKLGHRLRNDEFLKFLFIRRSCTPFWAHATAPSTARRVTT